MNHAYPLLRDVSAVARQGAGGGHKILILGLPGAGKTTLAQTLVKVVGAVHFNADAVRANVNKDLGFTPEDRIEQARRMGWLCDQVAATGQYVIADFVCPTPEARQAFGADDAFVVWVDRIAEGRFADTNKLFVPPEKVDLRVTVNGAPEFWAKQIADKVKPVFDYKQPTSMVIGRFQPFHDGHLKLIEASLARAGQVCIAVRDTQGTDDKNPFGFEEIRAFLEAGLQRHIGRFVIIKVPNISHVHWGRDVGYKLEQIDLDEATQAISATSVRERLGIGAPSSKAGEA